MELSKKSRLVRWAYWFGPKDNFTGKYIINATGEIVDGKGLHAASAASPTYVSYSYEKSNIPERTSFCRFFWRAFLITPIFTPLVALFLALAAMISGLLVIISLLSKHTKGTKWLPSEKIRKPLSILADATADKVVDGVDWIAGLHLWAYLKAVKQRMCPIVTFKD